MGRFYLSFILLLVSICTFAQQQTIVKMEKDGGVYKIPCVVNGLKLKLIFDTGASSVSLSETVAEMMLENDYLSVNDIKGKSQSQVADGRIVEHTNIILRKIEIGGKVLSNIEAIIVNEQSTPLLLGQSAISKLGKIALKDDKLIITNYKIEKDEDKAYSDEQLSNIIQKAIDFHNEGNCEIAAENYKIAYKNQALSTIGIIRYADCLLCMHQTDDALKLYLSIYDKIDDLSKSDKIWYYHRLQICYADVGEYEESIKFGQLALHLADYTTSYYTAIVESVSRAYCKSGKNYKAFSFAEDQTNKYLKYMDIQATDAWSKGYRDEMLAYLYFIQYLFLKDIEQAKKWLSLSAAWGYKDAIEMCKKYNVEYLSKPNIYEY